MYLPGSNRWITQTVQKVSSPAIQAKAHTTSAAGDVFSVKIDGGWQPALSTASLEHVVRSNQDRSDFLPLRRTSVGADTGRVRFVWSHDINE